jgi:hypothetical protein
MKWQAEPANGVCLVLPEEFATNGKLAAIQSSFIDVKQWLHLPLTTLPQWGLWLSVKDGSEPPPRQRRSAVPAANAP